MMSDRTVQLALVKMSDLSSLLVTVSRSSLMAFKRLSTIGSSSYSARSRSTLKTDMSMGTPNRVLHSYLTLLEKCVDVSGPPDLVGEVLFLDALVGRVLEAVVVQALVDVFLVQLLLALEQGHGQTTSKRHPEVAGRHCKQKKIS